MVPFGQSRSGSDPEVFTPPLAINQWHHITAVYNTNGAIKIFLDGKLQSSAGWSAPINFGITNSLTIGAVYPWEAPGYHFHGLISHATVWCTALSDEEIKYLPGLDFTNLPLSALVVYCLGMNGQTLSKVSTHCKVRHNNTNWVICNDLPDGKTPSEFASDIRNTFSVEADRTRAHNTISVGVNIPFAEIKLGKRLGEGGFGMVFLVEWKQEKYALKKMRLNDDSGEALKEARVLGRLKHNFIVSLVGVTKDPSTNELMLVMEYHENGSLEDLLREKGVKLSRGNVVQIALDIAEGLKYLHEQKIIHRDLKSANVLLFDNKTRAKLTDFGTARIFSNSSKATTIIGTLGFMAPEVFEDKPYNSKADVYSFGVVIYHMLTNTILPFVRTEADLEAKVGSKVQDRFFQKFITDCCKIEPNHRPTIQECIDQLKKCANQ